MNRRKFTKYLISSILSLYIPFNKIRKKYLKFVKFNYKNKTWILSPKD